MESYIKFQSRTTWHFEPNKECSLIVNNLSTGLHKPSRQNFKFLFEYILHII